VHESTTQAVPAILTGIEPKDGELPTLGDHPDNLFTLLAQRFAVHSSEQVTRLCPSRYCPRTAPPPLLDRERGLFDDVAVGYLYRVLPRSIVGELPPLGERLADFRGRSPEGLGDRVLGALNEEAWLRVAIDAVNQSARARQFSSFLEALRTPASRSQLYVEHALLPHSPWEFLPSGVEYGDGEAVAGMNEDWSRWRSNRELVDQALQRHLLQVGFADRLVGILLRRLEEIGVYDRALVIVTADHGASFEPNGYMRNVVKRNLADIAGVPLFVKYPAQRNGRVDDRGAKTIDIVPTIADVVGVRIPWHVDGISLRGKAVDRPVSVAKLDDDPVVGKVDAVEAGVLATARRNASLFGVGSHSMYRIGPFPDLLDTLPASLASATPVPGAVRFDDPKAFANVRLSSGLVPARVAGVISDDVAPVGTPLAISVDGRVRATTRAYEVDGQSRFEALVPETSFRDGRNAVEVYSVSRSNGEFSFRLIGGTPRVARSAIGDRTSRSASRTASVVGASVTRSRFAPVGRPG
jgi:hypothetical protein